MTAPRAREQADPPSPPDRLPPRRGGGSSPYPYAASAAGRPAEFARPRVARRGLVRAARALAAAALLALSGALALPAAAQTVPSAPTNFIAGVGDTQVTLSWDAPASDSGVTRHEYRFKTGTESYPATWEQISSKRSAPFQLPTLLICRVAPRAMSFNRERPRT